MTLKLCRKNACVLPVLSVGLEFSSEQHKEWNAGQPFCSACWAGTNNLKFRAYTLVFLSMHGT